MIAMIMIIRTTPKLSAQTLRVLVASSVELVCGLGHDAEYPH